MNAIVTCPKVVRIVVPGPPGPMSTPGGVVVEDFGAVADGVADNTTAIDAALDELESRGGGTLYFGPGTYRCGTFTIPSKCSLIGAGAGATIIKRVGGISINTPWIQNRNTNPSGSARLDSDIVIRGICFDGSECIWRDWLQKLDGTVITDPEADYVPVTGALASGITAPTFTAVLTGDQVTSITVNTGGAGFNGGGYSPSTVPLKITGGGGRGAAAHGNITAGAITSVTIDTHGVGYTSPPTVTSMGGYRDVSYLLTIDRRNPDYAVQGACINLTKVNRPRIENCRFVDYRSMVVSDAGCLSARIQNNVFERCGKKGGGFYGVWSQCQGNPLSPTASYQDSEDCLVVGNAFYDMNRGMILFSPTKGGICRDNIGRNMGESGIFVNLNAAKNGGRILISGCTMENIMLADISAHAIECHGHHVTIEGCYFNSPDFQCISGSDAEDMKVIGNTMRNGFMNRAGTQPFGPFSERYTYAAGTQPICGQEISTTEDGAYCTIGVTAAVAGKYQLYANNTFVETRSGNALPSAVFYSVKSGGNAIGHDVFIQHNVYDIPSTLAVWNDSMGSVWIAGKSAILQNWLGQGSGQYKAQSPNLDYDTNAYLTGLAWGTLTTGNINANILHLGQIFVAARRGFTQAAINVTTLAAGQARLGVWLPRQNGLPGALLQEFTLASQIDVSTTGVKTLTFPALMLERGKYWLGIVASAQIGVTAFPTGGNPYGVQLTGSTATPVTGLTKGFTYGPLESLDGQAVSSWIAATPLIGIR